MQLFEQLSRRRFFALLSASAFALVVPGVANALIPAPLMSAGKRAITRWEFLDVNARDAHGSAALLDGYVKKEANGDMLFTRFRHHCDYCYLGSANSVLRLTGAGMAEGKTRLSGRLDMRGKARMICV